ncbi:hypothetical protein DFH07DRAFT_949876 [Mycena maculata]|uniref:Uncharacterized protein n=1 Tax=Mycena maculata TaxID=230809 RepID=A0AAD7KAQ7_9AGAR|nr:hypothetical protein DFH07DRAFT_949876 [Mycena maculata]
MQRRQTNNPPPARRAPSHNKLTRDENQPPPTKDVSTALSDRINNHIDPYSDEMESKYNIEGSTYQDVVFLRQENDLALKQIEDQAAANAALQRELLALKARFGSDLTNQGLSMSTEVASDNRNELSDELEKAKAANIELLKQVDALMSARQQGTNSDSDGIEMIPRPPGSAGNNFNIQDEMGLGRNAEDRERYKALMRNIRDLVLQAGINWEVPWAKVPAEAKGKLYAVARKRHPILKRYVNDWATEEIVKQYIKNKRCHGYTKGFLEPPAEYAYLKTNSSKRDQSAPRGRRNKIPKAVVAVSKKAAQKKKTSAKAGSSGQGKTKLKKQRVVDEEDEAMSDA